MTPWIVAWESPPSMQFSRQEYWSGLPFLPPGDLPDSGIKPACPTSPVLTDGYFITELPGKPKMGILGNLFECMSLNLWRYQYRGCGTNRIGEAYPEEGNQVSKEILGLNLRDSSIIGSGGIKCWPRRWDSFLAIARVKINFPWFIFITFQNKRDPRDM